MANNYQFNNMYNNNNNNNIQMKNMNMNNIYMNNMSMNNMYMNNMNNIYMNDNNYTMNIINNNMNNIKNNNNNMNMNNGINNKNYITVIFSYNSIIKININIEEKISNLIEKYKQVAHIFDQDLVFYFNNIVLNPYLSIKEAGIKNNSIIYVKNKKAKDNDRIDECLILPSDNGFNDSLNGMQPGFTIPLPYGGKLPQQPGYVNPPPGIKPPQLEKVINVKFIKQPGNRNNFRTYLSSELYGLLKLCLLKEISSKLNDYQINNLPDIISSIMKILKNGYIDNPDAKICIKEVLEKIRGSNIINFSKYVSEIIGSNELNNIMAYLGSDQLNEINDIRNRLSLYNEYIIKFEREFEIAKKKSIFEFSVISLVIIEREDYDKFSNERKRCPNRIDRILFHGTNKEPISNILTGYFRKSIGKCCQHGEGVYFTDLLDYCWFYGGAGGNRVNKNKIPKIDETFTLIACSTYYDQNGFRKVIDYKYTPKKNEINFAYAGCQFETLINPDKNKFYGTEYVIWDLDQICPFISVKL